MLGYSLVLQKKNKEKNSNIEDKACCCKVNKMEIRFWKDDVISGSINIYSRLHPQTHINSGIYDILLLFWGGGRKYFKKQILSGSKKHFIQS